MKNKISCKLIFLYVDRHRYTLGVSYYKAIDYGNNLIKLMLIWKYFEDVKFVDTCYNTLYLEYLLLILDIVIYQTVDRQ